MKNKSLKVLVTRPLYAATELCNNIESIGAKAIIFPTIEITPTPNQAALKHFIQRLNTFDIIIFVSRTAAKFGMQAIQAQWQTLPTLLWAAIGPGTAKVLQEHGIHSILLPKVPPYETESLLETDVLQSVSEKKILICRGNGGRDLLSTELSNRGATVQMVETYQRRLPVPTSKLVERLTNYNDYSMQIDVDVIVTTSKDSLDNLLILAGPELSQQLKEIPIVVVGLRMSEFVLNLGFKRPLLAKSASNDSIMAVLTEFKDRRSENSHI